MGSEADLVKPRFGRGCRCFAVVIDGGIAGYGWLSTGPEWIGELQLEIRPRAGEAYVWNCTTLEPHRRQGIFRSLLTGISTFARQDGLRRLWIGSVAIPAEKAVAPSGFRPALRFRSLTLVGFHLMSVSDADPALSRDAREVLRSRTRISIRTSRPRRH